MLYNIIIPRTSILDVMGRNTNFKGDMKWKKKLLLCCLPVDRVHGCMH